MPAHSLISREEWREVRSVAETGMDLKEVAARFNLPFRAVYVRSKREGWLTVARVRELRRMHDEARNESVPNVTKEAIIAESDVDLSNQIRRITLEGVKTGLKSFFESPKVPENYQEAKMALEMGAKAANWGSESAVSLNFWGGMGGGGVCREVDSVQEDSESAASALETGEE